VNIIMAKKKAVAWDKLQRSPTNDDFAKFPVGLRWGLSHPTIWDAKALIRDQLPPAAQ
jgi:hypothetical protein